MPLGSMVDISVISDINHQMRVGGLGYATAVTGGSGQLDFTATTAGRYLVTLVGREAELAVPTVH